jgi:hypothetical protein
MIGRAEITTLTEESQKIFRVTISTSDPGETVT